MTLAARAKELGLEAARAVGEDDLALDAEDFAQVARELFATHPLRVVRLWNATGYELAAALATPELARVTELHLSRNRLTDADVEALVHSENVGSVVRLELGFCGLSGRTAAIVAKADPRRFVMPPTPKLIPGDPVASASGLVARAPRSRPRARGLPCSPRSSGFAGSM